MTASRPIEIVLAIRENDYRLLRSAPGVHLSVVQYDLAEDLLDHDADAPVDRDERGDTYLLFEPQVTCSVCYAAIASDEPRVSIGTAHTAASFCMTCAREGLPTDAPELPISTEIPYHAPVIAGLRAQGIPADEEATGGGNYHVSYTLPCGGFILADAPDGQWEVGLYRKTDDPDWRYGEGEMHDSGLDEDADPALVVAWLLEVTR